MIDYGRRLSRESVVRLAAGPGSLPVRLDAAFGALHPLLPRRWDEPIRSASIAVIEGYRVAMELGGDQGSIVKGCQRMHHTKRRALAEAVLDLYAAFVLGSQ